MSDVDFNHDPLEGSGTDVIHYRVPLNGYDEEISGEVSIYYQSLPPTWMQEIFSASTPEIDSFETMFDMADRSPVLMRNQSFMVEEYVGLNESPESEWGQIFSTSSCIVVLARKNLKLELFDAGGKIILKDDVQEHEQKTYSLSKGTYLVVLNDKWIEKVLVH